MYIHCIMIFPVGCCLKWLSYHFLALGYKHKQPNSKEHSQVFKIRGSIGYIVAFGKLYRDGGAFEVRRN